MGTSTAPAASTASPAYVHSGRVSASTQTRSPGPIPAATSPPARCRTGQRVDPQVVGEPVGVDPRVPAGDGQFRAGPVVPPAVRDAHHTGGDVVADRGGQVDPPDPGGDPRLPTVHQTEPRELCTL